ncbi:VOC family protein [Puniceibacterium sp. IMCC21224]|uniref:VOC family protein n=1 Tax=Puniceibacterium sp. IMCC21224 TaxID=1618204 RepID=UPI00064DC81A|nr:VOC family protein [Puniceibacterium sp. IMCC21224]KMK67589.1 Glyoxalase/Bleomycin resistance protein/Dioxygenase superfamily [Puniceibacterium sp. IMCC21224]
MSAQLEHVNIAVADPRITAEILTRLFDWTVRWEGAAMGDGYSVHVGAGQGYVALYRPGTQMQKAEPRYRRFGSLNHIGVTVDDLGAAEARVQAEGYVPHSHADYEPGKRFYFDGPDGVEYEVVSYG